MNPCIIYVKKKSSTLFFIAIISTFFSCNSYITLNSGLNKDTNRPYKKIEVYDEQQGTSTENKPTFAIVFLHGLRGYIGSRMYTNIAEKLKTEFGDKVLIFEPKKRQGSNSIGHSIEKQAKIVYNEIQNYIRPNQPLPIILIGYCQGGLVGCKIAKDYGDVLDIRSIITIHTPLNGAPMLAATVSDVEDLFQDSEPALNYIYNSPNKEEYLISTNKTIGQAKRKLKWRTIRLQLAQFKGMKWMFRTLAPGIKDLMLNSRIIKEIQTFLREENTKIPCLLMAGYRDEVKTFLNLNHSDLDKETEEALQKFDRACSRFLTKHEETKHDSLLPVATQLGRGPSFEQLHLIDTGTPPLSDMPIPIFDMPNKEVLTGFVYPCMAHGNYYFGIDQNIQILSIPRGIKPQQEEEQKEEQEQAMGNIGCDPRIPEDIYFFMRNELGY